MMQHHRCFRVYITKTRATRISDTVYFKHQYITNPTVSPESHVIAAAQQLATALQGNIPAGNEMAEALKKVSDLFTKIVVAKSEAAKAKAQRNRVRATPTARQTTHFPRVETPLPRVADPSEADCRIVPRVANGPQEDCRVVKDVPTLSMSWPVVQTPTTHSKSRPPLLTVQPPTGRPNYISQDKDDTPPTMRCTTRSTATSSIMQEAMLSCVDIYKPKYVLSADLGILNFAATVPTGTTYTVSPQKMSMRGIPMTWFCKMANLVIGDNGELLEYRHLIANSKMKTTWTHSYGNEIGRLAQGMPGCNSSTNTIVFIKKHQVPQDRAKDVIYGLIIPSSDPKN